VKSPRLGSIVISIICVGLIAGFLYYLYANRDKYLKLLHLSPLPICSLLVLALIFPILNGLINTYLFRSLGAELSHREGFLLAGASSLANQLPVSGGIVAKGYYLKRKFNLSYTKFLSATAALFICFIAVNGLIGCGILIYWILVRKIAVSPLLWIGFGLMAACLLVFWLPLDNLRISGRMREWVQEALQGWMLIGKNPMLLVKLVGLQTSLSVLLALRYWIAFHLLSQDVTMAQTMLFSSASVLNQLASFAPGGLGITEAIVGGVASALGFELAVSVVAVGLDRLVSTFAIVVVGVISTAALGRQLSKMPTEPRGQEALN
jgi:uncharacterized membrane protein YbhN (UPF0104 family)